MAQIRTATTADIPALVDAWYAMLDECGLIGSGLVDDWRDRLAHHFQHQIERDHARWFVAEEDGRIVGTCLASLSSGRSNILKDVSAMLAGIYVDPAYRARGIARRLTEDAIAWCTQRGCVRVRLHSSAAGRHLYESLGFVPATEMMRLDL
jgi:GNAT superfamily N-acetyltransferase